MRDFGLARRFGVAPHLFPLFFMVVGIDAVIKWGWGGGQTDSVSYCPRLVWGEWVLRG